MLSSIRLNCCSAMLTIVFSTSLPAQDTCSNPDVRFDHANPSAFFLPIKKGDGEQIVICIENTLPDSFLYEVSGLKLPAEAETREAAQLETPAAVDKEIRQRHDKQYGGYLVRIQAKSGAPTEALVDGEKKTLRDAQFIVSVQTVNWQYEVSGGFTINKLSSPVFGLRPRQGDSGMMEVFRDEEKEDNVRLGVAGFIHVYHDRYPWLVPTFGLGINEGNTPTYYTGMSWRLGKAAALTAGAAWGSVDTLPAGTQLGPVTDANVLNNLQSRTDAGFFFALSYTFLNPGIDFFEKPIKGEGQQSGLSAPAAPQKASLRLEKSAAVANPAEKTIDYKLKVFNDGTVDAKDVQVTDDLAAGNLEIVGNQPEGTTLIPGDKGILWSIGELAQGSQQEKTIPTKVKESFTENSLENTATLTATDADIAGSPAKVKTTLPSDEPDEEDEEEEAGSAGSLETGPLDPSVFRSPASLAGQGREIRAGMTSAQVESTFGAPVARHQRGETILYRYPHMVVKLEEGKVVDAGFWLGMTADELESFFGPPDTKALLGTRVLYQYADLIVELTDGTVARTRP